MTAPGSPVIKLGDIRQIKAVFAVPEGSRPLLREGQKVSIAADTLPGKTFAGRVRTLGYEADNRSRTFPVEITVANPSEALLPGMVARLALNGVSADAPYNARSAVIVPVASVASDEGGGYVVVLKEGVATRRAVTLGAPVGAETVEITSGLAVGEIIAKTPQRLTNGARVQLVARK